MGCVLRRRGDVVATAAGAAVIGHPAAAVASLANGRNGEGADYQSLRRSIGRVRAVASAVWP